MVSSFYLSGRDGTLSATIGTRSKSCKFAMNIKQILLQQFGSSYDTNGWFVATKNAIAGMTAEQAAWKPEGSDNSAWQLLSHMNYYNGAYLERFQGRTFEYDIEENSETFTQSASGEDWPKEVERFEKLMDEWRSVIESADDSKFDEIAPPYNR